VVRAGACIQALGLYWLGRAHLSTKLTVWGRRSVCPTPEHESRRRFREEGCPYPLCAPGYRLDGFRIEAVCRSWLTVSRMLRAHPSHLPFVRLPDMPATEHAHTRVRTTYNIQ